MVDPKALLAHWQKLCPGVPPVANVLREHFASRWVRFHGLPRNQRYPKNEQEYATVLQRHNELLGELFTPGEEVVLITEGSSDGPEPPRESWAQARYSPDLQAHDPSAQLWLTMKEGEHPAVGGKRHPYWHFFTSAWSWRAGVFDPVLRLVADDHIGGVLILSLKGGSIYHPYDGGADLILETSAQRDALSGKYAGWLPWDPAQEPLPEEVVVRGKKLRVGDRVDVDPQARPSPMKPPRQFLVTLGPGRSGTLTGFRWSEGNREKPLGLVSWDAQRWPLWYEPDEEVFAESFEAAVDLDSLRPISLTTAFAPPPAAQCLADETVWPTQGEPFRWTVYATSAAAQEVLEFYTRSMGRSPDEDGCKWVEPCPPYVQTLEVHAAQRRERLPPSVHGRIPPEAQTLVMIIMRTALAPDQPPPD
jgi:hypothetical protein